MDFQVNDQTYFLNIGDNDGGWEVMVATPNGAREIPVYVDSAQGERTIVLQADEHRLPN